MDGSIGYYPLLEHTEEARGLWDATSQVMEVRTVQWMDEGVSRALGQRAPAETRVLEMKGRLTVDSEQAYETLSERFRALGYVALLRRDRLEHRVLAVQGEIPSDTGRTGVVAAMFGLTLLSVLWVGAGHAGEPDNLLAGWPFAASLLGILLAHEMGHYVVARWQGVPASLPYFIPFPTLLGTMGAVIQTKAPPRDRRGLILLGASGPFAGMLVALPVLLIGLSMSEVTRIPTDVPTIQEGNSLLYAMLKLLVFGRFLPSDGIDVFIHPVAFAGWAGLLVTGLNLIPAGQLDGGHIAYAVLGRRARYLTWLVIAVLLGLSTLWKGWLLWAGLVLLLGRVHSVPLDDVTRLGGRELAIAGSALILFVLVFIPIPILIS